jgi:hypothetical protein
MVHTVKIVVVKHIVSGQGNQGEGNFKKMLEAVVYVRQIQLTVLRDKMMSSQIMFITWKSYFSQDK